MTRARLRDGLAAARRRLRSIRSGNVPATGSRGHDPNTRIHDGELTEWKSTARPAPPFALDACFDAPAYVPGWMLAEGVSDSRRIDPVPLPNHVGAVTTADAFGREEVLAAHYRRILDAAPPPTQWRQDIARFACFDVDLVIGLAGEHPLRIEMFGGAASAAADLLGQLADPTSPDTVLYDNLDQNRALRMTTAGEDVFTLEWDWERPASEDVPRALRFSRPRLAAQARSALQRLEHVHGALVHAVGTDLWNVPPRRA